MRRLVSRFSVSLLLTLLVSSSSAFAEPVSIDWSKISKAHQKPIKDIQKAHEQKAAPDSIACDLARAGFQLILDIFTPPKSTVNPPYVVSIALTYFLKSECYHTWAHDNDPRYADNIRMTGPLINGVGYMTHARVRIYYSKEAVDWLEGGRKGKIEDKAVIIKEMFFTNPHPGKDGPDPQEINGWAVMVRSNESTKDGWLWFLHYPNGSPTTGGKPYTGSQYGLSFCLSCHASADTDQVTFISLDNILGKNVVSYAYVKQPPDSVPNNLLNANPPVVKSSAGPHGNFANSTNLAVEAKLRSPSKFVNQPVVDLFQKLFKKNPPSFIKKMPTKAEIKKLAFPNSLTMDHAVPQAGHLDQFVSSDSCQGCHDATYLLNGLWPNMLVTDNKTKQYFISPFSEWATSMMGLSGRDPVFHAQLESEKALRPNYGGDIANFCLSCHAVMGKRQFDLDRKAKGEPFKNFSEDILYATPLGPNPELAKEGKYGALARDGVSCTVCHHVIPEGLGTKKTFSGKFKVGPPDEVYGPFASDQVLTYPMKQALGITPKYGKQIKDSDLCGSCHTVEPPKIPLKGGKKGPLKPFNSFSHSNEQTTWMEWENSDFKNKNETCANCHLPNHFPPAMIKEGKTSPLPPFRIANIETPDFPQVPNMTAPENIDLKPKAGYRRHTLVGMNLFTIKIFNQFQGLNGFSQFFPGTPAPPLPPDANPVQPLDLAEQEIIWQAKNKTVELSIDSLKETKGNLEAKVSVINLGGHKFPTGVGFRRAFLQFSVLGGSDGNQILWSSGRTSPAGVLIDQNGDWLPSEFTDNPKKLQNNYSLISKQDQVQIYENRETNNLGKLTTSFLGLFNEYKDNRILPKGWSSTGLYNKKTAPYEKGKRVYPKPDEIGQDHVTYQIPLFKIQEAKSVQVGLYYQSIPPYFLRDRFATGGKAAERLYYFVTHLDVGKDIENWRMQLATLIKKDLP
jgi:hypothetical protein